MAMWINAAFFNEPLIYKQRIYNIKKIPLVPKCGLPFCQNLNLNRKILGGGGRVYMADIDETKGKETIEELQTEFGKVIYFSKTPLKKSFKIF